ncbi:peptidase thermolysin [Fusarium longipes]|uniref:Peptidase thermolysin n=1 Tax=Fusarium longipes TaxID=694270 RepID=A0A395T2G2_9HYPO|nr:peptidase thermolysin [Fusarium longipes]
MESSWCSFIPNNLLSELANNDSLDEGTQKSMKETITVGNTLYSKEKKYPIVDIGDQKLDRAERSQPLSSIELPDQIELIDGEIYDHRGGLKALIYTARGQEVLPGENALSGRGGHLDRERGLSVRSTVRSIFSFFEFEFGHKLFEKEAYTIAITINYGHHYTNAHWTGKRVILGSGNPSLWDEFHLAKDVIGHEITHGIILRTSGLNSSGEAGALGESLCDVFGLLYKHSVEDPSADAKDCVWTIGESLWSPPDGFFGSMGIPADVIKSLWTGSGGKIVDNHTRQNPNVARDVTSTAAVNFNKLPHYLRSFKNPRLITPSQPMHYDDYKELNYDNGGVHHNSGIGNYAFYVAATEAEEPPLDGVGKVWFRAMTDTGLGIDCTYPRFAAFTIAYAKRDFPYLVEPIEIAWDETGVLSWNAAGVVPDIIPGLEEMLSNPPLNPPELS